MNRRSDIQSIQERGEQTQALIKLKEENRILKNRLKTALADNAMLRTRTAYYDDIGGCRG